MQTSKKYLYDIPEDPNHAACKIIAWIDRDMDVLEVGCASGIQTRYLQEQLGCRVTGIEIDPQAAEDARPFCENLIIGDIDGLDLTNELGDCRYDAITFVDVLEHLYDPGSTLKKVRPFLKENGHLIASIPNIAHAAICWELAHGRFDYQKFGLLDNTHIRFFTKKNVARLFEEAGYRIVSWDQVTKAPKETEFNVQCNSVQDQAFLDWICDSNPEAYTYQFIVKACPAKDDSHETSYELLEAQDTIRQLETKIHDVSQKNVKLQSQISWLENHRFGVFSSIITRLRSKNKN